MEAILQSLEQTDMIEQWRNMVATLQGQNRRFGLLRIPERLQENQSFDLLSRTPVSPMQSRGAISAAKGNGYESCRIQYPISIEALHKEAVRGQKSGR